jgi:hypothetical protein
MAFQQCFSEMIGTQVLKDWNAGILPARTQSVRKVSNYFWVENMPRQLAFCKRWQARCLRSPKYLQARYLRS